MKKDGIGQDLEIDDMVVRCGYGQYAQVVLYKIIKFTEKQVTITQQFKDGNIIKTHLDHYSEECKKISVSPSTLVKVTKNLTDLGYKLARKIQQL